MAEPALSPIQPADFDTIARLAREIWLAHYTTIISREQIEYMLGPRFSAENLGKYIGANDRWMYVLNADGAPGGYLSYSLSDAPREMKLEQLYLLPALHGRGIGKFMMARVEAHARELGCDTLMLTVNKANEKAIRAYKGTGFTVRAEAVFDIGNGYVMDDYVMEKPI
jgi:ribosomal protein S18 acetylase RimI-like enzyme